MIDMAAAAAATDDVRVRANVTRLAAAQALTGANSAVLANYGWAAVNWVVFPPVFLGITVLLLVSLIKRRAALPSF
jgi:uncharacterized membrane protein